MIYNPVLYNGSYTNLHKGLFEYLNIIIVFHFKINYFEMKKTNKKVKAR